MWMSTDAEQDLCASEATNSRKLKSIGNTHIDLENEKLKVGKYSVISGNEFSFLTKSFNSETDCVCEQHSSLLENINKII